VTGSALQNIRLRIGKRRIPLWNDQRCNWKKGAFQMGKPREDGGRKSTYHLEKRRVSCCQVVVRLTAPWTMSCSSRHGYTCGVTATCNSNNV